MNIKNLISTRMYHALKKIQAQSFFNIIQIKPSSHPKFGDYQVNGLILLSKQLSISTEILIEKLITVLNVNDIAKIKFEKPGFINFFLKKTWIEYQINNIYDLPNFGIIPIGPSKTVVIDYSGPNIAKEMHVGHLRSTVIGDSVARILSFLGHNVIRANHIGDWGTQFGILIAYIKINKLYNFLINNCNKITKFTILEDLYQKATKEYNTNPNFTKLARNYVVKLQTGNQDCQQIWEHLVKISISNNQKLYKRLNITLQESDIMGESSYQNMLPDIIQDLQNKKIAVNSNGAIVVFLNNIHTQQNKSNFGVIIQKQDGGYLYSTTDIACIKYRCETLKADRIIYYTDSRQTQHLTQVWKIATIAGYIKQSTSLEHHICGMLLEKHGKPFKTRSGNSLKLTELLNEAQKRARDIIYQKNPHLTTNQINKIAHIISIGAIKYAELSKNRTTNYVFNWDEMLNFQGNTAPYIQYAYTRICSIINRCNQTDLHKKHYNIQLNNSEEITLATYLLQFSESIVTVSQKGTPHILCAYLYKLSTLFSSFYEKCPILSAHNIYTKHSRLKLILLTAKTLKKGLNLLGIKTITRM